MKKALQPILTIIILFLFAAGLKAQTNILTQNFSSGSIPSGWSTTVLDATSKGFHVGTYESLSWQLFQIPAYTGHIAATDNYAFGDTTANIDGVDRLITPAMNFTSYGHVVLYFDAFYLGQQAETYPDLSTAEVMASSDGGTTWDLVEQIPGSAQWQHIAIDLSLSYAGQSNVKLAFEFDDGGYSALEGAYTGCPYGFAIANVSFVSPADYDIALTSLNIPPLTAVNNAGTSFAPIIGVLQDRGGYPITSATINWSVNGGSAQSENLSQLNISTAGNYNFKLNSGITMPAPDSPYNVTVWVTEPDGQTITGSSYDTLSATVYGVSGQVKRNVLIEEATGEWCGWCPDGAYILDTTLAAHPDILAVSIHDDGGYGAEYDTLEIADGETFVDYFISSFPSGAIDRKYYAFDNAVGQPRVYWDSLAVAELPVVEPVTVGLYNTYDSATRTISAIVLAKFYGSLSGYYSVNVYVCEDSVRSWQHNYLSNAYNPGAFPTSPFYDSAFDITDFPENRVVRAMLGGTFGTAGVIPNPTQYGKEYTQSYSYTIPIGFNPKRMFLVATVEKIDSSDVDDMPVLNSVKCPFNSFAQNSVVATYYTSDTGTANTGNSIVFYRGDSLYYQGGFIVFQLGDTVTVNGTVYIINALNDSIILQPGDQVTVTGPTGSGSTTFPTGHYSQFSFGTVSFVNIADIANVNAKESLNVYPNPTDKQLNLTLNLAQNSEVQVSLADVAGQLVKNVETLNMSSGANNLSLSTANLSPGIYILTVRTAQSSLSSKVVIAR